MRPYPPVQCSYVHSTRHRAIRAVTGASEEPAWKQRAVERSIRTAKLRAEQRVQRFLDAAQAIITEKGSTDFTVQEVVDRSKQSLRSFYLQFDGKHELLLALFEDALSRSADQIRAAAAGEKAPLDQLRVAVELLFESSRPDPTAQRPLFTDSRAAAAHPPRRGEGRARPDARAVHGADGEGRRRGQPPRGAEPEADGRHDDADRDVHRSVERRRRQHDPSHHGRRGLELLLAGIRRPLTRTPFSNRSSSLTLGS